MALTLSSLSKWAPLINTGAQALLAGVASKKAGDTLSSADARYNNIEDVRLGLALKNDERADQLMGRYTDTFMPIQDRAITLGTKRISPEIEAGKAAADVQDQVAVQQGALKRQYGRMGVNPNDGAAIDAQARLALGAGLGRAAASTNARRNAVDTELQRLIAVNSLGTGLPGQASGFTGQAASGVADILNQRSRLLSDAQNNAQQAGGELGGSLADVIGTIFGQGSEIGKLLGLGAAATPAAGAPSAATTTAVGNAAGTSLGTALGAAGIGSAIGAGLGGAAAAAPAAGLISLGEFVPTGFGAAGAAAGAGAGAAAAGAGAGAGTAGTLAGAGGGVASGGAGGGATAAGAGAGAGSSLAAALGPLSVIGAMAFGGFNSRADKVSPYWTLDVNGNEVYVTNGDQQQTILDAFQRKAMREGAQYQDPAMFDPTSPQYAAAAETALGPNWRETLAAAMGG
ncbi:MAG TPA: hypothetical protein VEQ17_07980 [Steroidobacteraceae bacterium]|nr:hypothetical protein [Steroidobacteraceae bacterium]